MYAGSRKGIDLEISTASESKNGPVYTVTARTRATRSETWKEGKVVGSFAEWFSADGYFVAKPFQRFLARGIAVVGEADPKNASLEEESVSAVKGQSAAASGQQAAQFNVNISNLPDVLKHIQAQGNTASRRK